MGGGEALYELKAVSKHFRRGPSLVKAVDEVDLIVGRGEFLVIQGPSGSGKSTLLNLLGGLERPTSGQVLFRGKDMGSVAEGELASLRLRVFGFVFQQFNLIPTLTALENVEAALAPAVRDGARRRARAVDVLEQVGLLERSGHLPSELSGGEQQRVAIARALANDPEVILADEPTGDLDSASGAEVVRRLEELSSEGGKTVVLVTHDQSIGGRASRLLLMRDGRLFPA